MPQPSQNGSDLRSVLCLLFFFSILPFLQVLFHFLQSQLLELFIFVSFSVLIFFHTYISCEKKAATNSRETPSLNPHLLSPNS